MRRLAVALLVLAGCARREDPLIAPVDERHAARAVEPLDALPTVRSQDDVARHDHRRVVVEGWYEIVPVPGGKGAQPACVVLVDGTRVIRAYAPVVEELGLANRRVRVVGTVTAGPPDGSLQAMGGPHVHVERIELASGETAITPAPTEVPTPPMVTTLPGFAPHLDRWVAVSGTLESLSLADGAWSSARLRLSDGGVALVARVVERTWAPYLGKPLTTLGRVSVIGRDAGLGLDVRLAAVGAPCAGLEPRCGMAR